MTVQRLTEDEIAAALAELPGWTREGDSITRTVKHPGFGAALGWVTRIGFLADRVGHHPDIDIRYNLVTLRLSSHDAGGLTLADVELAKRIDKTL